MRHLWVVSSETCRELLIDQQAVARALPCVKSAGSYLTLGRLTLICSVGWDHLGSAPGPSTPGHYGDASDNMFQDLTPTSFIAEFNGPSRFFPNLNQLLGSFTGTFALSF